MYGSNLGGITSSLSLTKVISGISKTLNIANQVIPLYQQVKPIISNASSILSVFKEFNSNDDKDTTPSPSNSVKSTTPVVTNTLPEKKELVANGLPTFFQ